MRPASLCSPSRTTSAWVHNDSDLAAVWALDWFVTMAKMVARRRCHLDREVTKIDEEWSLSDTAVNANRPRAPLPGSTFAAVALRMA